MSNLWDPARHLPAVGPCFRRGDEFYLHLSAIGSCFRGGDEKEEGGPCGPPSFGFPLVARLGDDYPCLVGVDPVGCAGLDHVG